MTDQLKPNTAAAIAFMQGAKPGEPWHFVAIDSAGRLVSRTFQVNDHENAAFWIDSLQGKAGLYFQVNRLSEGLENLRAKKSDIAEAVFLHVDIDSLDGISAIQSFPIRPTAIVMSGGGYHAYWKLSEPYSNLALIERINASIADMLGGDHCCHNVDRILRLPGTINIPSEKKRAAGRVEVLAEVVEANWAREYDVEDFFQFDAGPTAASSALVVNEPIKVCELDDLPSSVMPSTRRLIELGDDQHRPRGGLDPKYPSRSEAVFHAACDLARAGCSEALIAGVLINPRLGVSASIVEKKNPQSYALKQARAAHATVGEGWPDVSTAGDPKPTMRNAILALRRLGLSFALDLFRHRKSVNGAPLEHAQGELSDDMCVLLRGVVMERFGFDPRAEHIVDAVNLLCLEHPFHPIRQMLDELSWDGEARLDRWLATYLGADDTPLNSAIGSILLIAAVRRVRQPGVKFDQIVVLEGVQGSGKSTTVRILAGEGFHADQEIMNLDTKAQIEALDGIWFYELGEVEGMNRAEVNKIKAFASRQDDRARMAYGRFAVTRPRQAVFIGTTNDEKYLRDQTGNRRFWPVKTTVIDLVALQRDRDQLLAEAAFREARGESIVLPRELWEAAAAEQAARLEDDPWVDRIEDAKPQIVGETLRHYTSVLLAEALGIPPERQTQAHTKRLALLMTKLGWIDGKYRVGKRVVRGYEKPKPADYHRIPDKPSPFGSSVP